ncbi:MAG: GNAT family N-acetyltransferase [Defluviitaleaceae bacterium]|nr:GNAT family N-acetyltransferase [Defluviitaleaceae bacterium]
MNRKTYISDDAIALAEYIPSEDAQDQYNCWQDEGTQSGYNYKRTESFEEYYSSGIKSRFIATIIRLSDQARVGAIFLSPEDTEPDLAIMIYKPFRGAGCGTRAFLLGTHYCFDVLGLEYVYAGCFAHNTLSRKMLQKCGFHPYPKGNQAEKHIITGEEIVQYDYVKYNPECLEFDLGTVIGVPSVDENGDVLSKALVGSYVIIPKSHVPNPI